jgi:hypothetical protein
MRPDPAQAAHGRPTPKRPVSIPPSPSHSAHGLLIAGRPSSARVEATAPGQQNAHQAALPTWQSRHQPLETPAGSATRPVPAHECNAEASRQPSQIIAFGAPHPTHVTPVRSAPATSITVGVISMSARVSRPPLSRDP